MHVLVLAVLYLHFRLLWAVQSFHTREPPTRHSIDVVLDHRFRNAGALFTLSSSTVVSEQPNYQWLDHCDIDVKTQHHIPQQELVFAEEERILLFRQEVVEKLQ